MSWAKLLLTANILLAIAVWVGRNEWSHKYLRSIGRSVNKLNPWYKTNQLLKLLLEEVKDSSGKPLRTALEHLGDGLDRVQATLAMIHVRQRMYDRILENATLTTDAKGKVTWASDGLLKLANCSLEDLRNDGWINAIYQDDRQVVIDEWRHSVRDGRDFVLSYRYRGNSPGEVVWVEAHAYAARAASSQAPVGWVAVVRRIKPPAPQQDPPLVEPRVRAANLRMDAERRCYHPEMGSEGSRDEL